MKSEKVIACGEEWRLTLSYDVAYLYLDNAVHAKVDALEASQISAAIGLYPSVLDEICEKWLKAKKENVEE